jgi:hypothetical protein
MSDFPDPADNPRRDPVLGPVLSEITQMIAKHTAEGAMFEGADVTVEGYTLNMWWRKRWIKIYVKDAREREPL